MDNKNIISGIYRLDFSTGHFYIGKSFDIIGRARGHLNCLKRNKHFNKKMQALYNTHRNPPTLTILLVCENHNMIPKENVLIEKARKDFPDMCLNINCNKIAKLRAAKVREIKPRRYRVVIDQLTADQFRGILQKYDTIDNALKRLIEIDM